MPLMFVENFKTQTEKSNSFFRGSMSKIDAALENYHGKMRTANTPGDQAALLYSVFQACVYWLKKKEFRSEFTTNMIGMKTNYFDQNFLTRRTEVKNLGNAALNEIFQILVSNNLLDVNNNSGLWKFDKNKLDMLANSQAKRPALKPMEKSYQNERTTYVKSGKTSGISGSEVHSVHENALNLVSNLSRKALAVLNKDIDNLSVQDWKILDELSKHPNVNQSGDLIYKKKLERLEMMVTSDAQGRLKDAEDNLFSTRANQVGIYAMDRYGNLFIEPPTLNVGSNYFNHSSFNCGQDVISAGDIKVEQGIIKLIDNGSGHYKPSRQNLHECVKMLDRQGVDLTQAQVEVVKTNPVVRVAATQFLVTG